MGQICSFFVTLGSGVDKKKFQLFALHRMGQICSFLLFFAPGSGGCASKGKKPLPAAALGCWGMDLFPLSSDGFSSR